MQLIRYSRGLKKTEQCRVFMDKVRLAGSLELSCESKNKKDREGTLESREYMIVLGVKKAENWTREQCGEWTEE